MINSDTNIIQTALPGGAIRLELECNELGLESASGWESPLELPSSLPSVLPFNFSLLPGTLRPWVQDVAERMQCPPDFTAVALIIAMASVIGRKLGIRPKQHDNWQEVPNLWAMVIGRPGLLKTPAIAQGLAPLNHLDSLALKKHQNEMAAYEVAALVAAERIKHTKKKIADAVSNGDENAARAEAESVIKDQAPPPKRHRYKVNDSTVEKLVELLNENPNGLLLHRDELVGFLLSLEKQGREEARAFFLESWTGMGEFTTDRIGRGTIRVEAVTMSILGSIQPGPLSAYLRDAVRAGIGDDGLLQRFQLSVWPDVPAEWENIDREPNKAAMQEVLAVFEHLDSLSAASAGAIHNSIPFLRFTPEAQDRFDSWHGELEIRLRSDCDHPVLQAHLAKYRKLVPALALILHLANRGTGSVTLVALEQALAWSVYLESHAQRIYASVKKHDEMAARELAKHLKAGDLPPTFLLRKVYRKGWTGLDTKEDVEPALEILCELNWIRPFALPDEASSKNGRPHGAAFEINPLLKISSKKRTAKTAESPADAVLAVLAPTVTTT